MDRTAGASAIKLLWDESQIWGLLVYKALTAWGFPLELVRGSEAAAGALTAHPPRVLIVPGGFARKKSASLGCAAVAAVRDYVERGGTYLGFCGGAGLALSGDAGLELCPWTRRPFTERLHHFLSGHIHVRPLAGDDLVPDTLPEHPLVPVWWPGQFAPAPDPGVTVLASYEEPGDDFWVADLNLSLLPPGVFAEWESLYGLTLKPDFLAGRPCIIRGNLGRGRYILSYAHLETPESPHANLWLAHILSSLTGLRPVDPGQSTLPAWPLTELPEAWEDPVLHRARRALDEIIRIGTDNLLLFWRNSWLLGWRRGIPGGSLNNLYALVCQAASALPTPQADEYWRQESAAFDETLALFRKGVTGYLLAERLAMTISREAPGAVPAKGLKDQRAVLFGPPPSCGGLYARLSSVLDELIWLLLK